MYKSLNDLRGALTASLKKSGYSVENGKVDGVFSVGLNCKIGDEFKTVWFIEVRLSKEDLLVSIDESKAEIHKVLEDFFPETEEQFLSRFIDIEESQDGSFLIQESMQKGEQLSPTVKNALWHAHQLAVSQNVRGG